MFQIFNLIIYFSPFCGKLPNPPWRNGIFPHLEAEFVALSESLRQLEELEQREVPRGASFGGCLEIGRVLQKKMHRETVTRRLVFLKDLWDFFVGFLWDDVLCYFHVLW